MQARVALEEVIKRWPDWEVDYANATKAHTSSVRGWSKLPRLHLARLAAYGGWFGTPWNKGAVGPAVTQPSSFVTRWGAKTAP